MIHTLHNKIQRVSDLITEYDEDEDLHRNPNPALHDFVNKLKAILNTSSLSSASQIEVGDANNTPHPKVIEALGNHVVLTEIFKCGTFCDLKYFRLVNKQWKGIANSAIIRRRLWKLRINVKFSRYKMNRNESFLKLIDCIEASGGSFPLTTLDFSNVDDYHFFSFSFPRFYALMGQSFKHVKFNNFGPLTINEFQDLLVNKMPNVDHIDAGNIFFTNQEEYSAPLVLPHLKTIRFIPHNDNDDNDDESNVESEMLPPPYFKDILLAAINLKEILDFHVYLTDAVTETGKLDCIQTFNLNSPALPYSEMCMKFAVSKPKLTTIRITRRYFDEDDEVADFIVSPVLALSLKLILVSSKDTLKHFQIAPFVLPSNFEYPKLPKLEFLTVINEAFDNGTDTLARVFTAGCDCSAIFPNVHTVSLDTGIGSLISNFPDQEFSSVKTLTFLNNFQLGSSLKRIFLNVSHIKIIDFEVAMLFRQRFGVHRGYRPELDNQIESLEFHHCLLGPLGREFELDSMFTGVPPHGCRKLLGMHKDCKARDEDENILFVKEILEVVQTQNHMFSNSQGLRRLKIIFNHKGNAHFRISKNSDGRDVESRNAVISPVSCVYGFSLMPNLEQVIIGYDHFLPNASDIAQVFKSFAQFPYVKIVHEPTQLSRDA